MPAPPHLCLRSPSPSSQEATSASPSGGTCTLNPGRSLQALNRICHVHSHVHRDQGPGRGHSFFETTFNQLHVRGKESFGVAEVLIQVYFKILVKELPNLQGFTV